MDNKKNNLASLVEALANAKNDTSADNSTEMTVTTHDGIKVKLDEGDIQGMDF